MSSSALQVGTPSPGAIRRLQQEMKLLAKSPPEGIVARPDESNILLWHYVLTGPKGTPYEGGTYLGKLRFPPDYPFAPPSILMTTPNGRFKTDMRLCLSISDYHPKEWNPVWNVSTILTGLLSFMVANEITAGSMESTVEQKKYLARHSHAFNAKFAVFRANFPELIEEEEKLAFAVANPNWVVASRTGQENSITEERSAEGVATGEKEANATEDSDLRHARGTASGPSAENNVSSGDNRNNDNISDNNNNTRLGSNVSAAVGLNASTTTAAASTTTPSTIPNSNSNGTTTTTVGAAGAHLVARTSSKNTAVVVKAPTMVSALYDAAWSFARRLIIIMIQGSVAAVALAFVVLMTM